MYETLQLSCTQPSIVLYCYCCLDRLALTMQLGLPVADMLCKLLSPCHVEDSAASSAECASRLKVTSWPSRFATAVVES